MKSTRKPNGTTAASFQALASCPPATEHPANAANIIDRKERYSLPQPAALPNAEEAAFRNFLLSRLPQTKAPQSLRKKIQRLIEQSRP